LIGLVPTAHVGADVANHTIDHFAPKIAGAYYHFTDKRFTAWGRSSKVLVPRAAENIRLVNEGFAIGALAVADYELYKSIGECSEVLR
jgi:hypothetical protein